MISPDYRDLIERSARSGFTVDHELNFKLLEELERAANEKPAHIKGVCVTFRGALLGVGPWTVRLRYGNAP